MSISAISPVGGALVAPAPSTAAESTYLIDTYGAPYVGAILSANPVYAQPVTPLVQPPAPVAGAGGVLIDTYA